MEEKYNHNRDLESFQTEIDIIKGRGYQLLGVSQMYLEDVYIFKTHEEATKAYEEFEVDTREAIGWWESIESYEEAISKYNERSLNKCEVKIFWL